MEQITGLDIFKNHFIEHKHKYVLIGGSACYLNLQEQGLGFGRTTKDLDIVLLLDVDRVDAEFTNALWQFVEIGEYKIKQRSGKPVFYRFENPQNKTFPAMIELFSRKLESLTLHGDSVCTPIPAEDELSSLSAILLNDDYYNLITDNCKTVNDIQIVTPECLIALKAKAFLDLSERNADTNKIKKHKNDVFRLAPTLIEENRCVVPETITNDLKRFIDAMKTEPIDLKILNVNVGTKNQILDVICKIYGITSI
ncbi:MAG TPA: hypothetical protein VKY57_04595 [Chitinispirillaceae bacterium]|nr:hypothetical protein [Chitinispirillaceae bacterium]